ncbi:hypothetical protein [Chryseobacterium daeguense]|uniref:hypothetical protein n=1 Tax=Chryseobacterium daeguense TaxID=412438 RepID=UPI000419D443|nr:hypothetical protein [Chryseobacterium daeguense]
MITKYKYFAIGDSIFYNNGGFCVKVRVNTEFPSIEYIEDHTVKYYQETWDKNTIEIDKEIFEKRFNEIYDVIKSRLNL